MSVLMRPRRLWRWMAGLVAAVVLSTGGGMAAAAWHANAPIGSATFTAGDLSLTLDGPLSWVCPEQAASGNATELGSFLLAPGQSLVLRQAIETVTSGDNLSVALSVVLPGLPGGSTGTWHLEAYDPQAAGDVQVAPASGEATLDQALVLPDLDVTQWVVVVTVGLPAGDLDWVDPTASPSPSATPLNLGMMTVTADQVRCGTGFTAACPAPGEATDGQA